MPLPTQFGPYLLLEKLGEGAQGDVHLARHVRHDFPLVIKRLSPRHADDEDFVRRFQHEAVIATSVESPHVIQVLDAGRVGDRLYLAMEHVAGWPLSDVIRELVASRHRASLSSIADVVAGALDGLHALHTARAPDGTRLGIVHRDVAPKNLMLSRDGVVKVIDLGLGKSKRQDWVTSTGVIMGTPGYLAPEQATAESIDHRADVFAMGAVLFELLTLQHYIPVGPIVEMLAATVTSRFRPPSSMRPDVPPKVDEIVRRAVALDPNDRFRSAKEFADAVRSAIPQRRRQTARTLLYLLRGGDLEKTEIAWRRRIAIPVRAVDDVEVSKRIVFSERDVDAYAATVSKQRRSSPLRAPITAIAAALLVALGWLGRGWLEPSQEPAPVKELPPPAVAREPPRPIATARSVEDERATPIEPSVPKRRPRKIAATPIAPIAPAAPPPPKPTEAQLRQRLARTVAGAIRLAPKDERAKSLAVRLNRLTSLPSLDGYEQEVIDGERELDAIQRGGRKP